MADVEETKYKECFFLSSSREVDKLGIAVDKKYGLDTIDFEADEDFQRLITDGLSL